VKRFLQPFVASLFAAAISACSGGTNPLPLAQPADEPMEPAVTSTSHFAPYVDLTSWPRPDLATYAKATGTRYFTFAFVQSYQSNQCVAAWGGQTLPGPASSSSGWSEGDQLKAIRRLGGDGILSFGGAAGLDLASACPDAASLAKAIETVVDHYRFKAIDFDIEGDQPANTTAVARRSQALKLVQDHYGALGKTLAISYTLPVMPWGFPQDELNVVKSAMQNGVHLGAINIMTMDYGPSYQSSMGAYAISAATHTLAQLRQLNFPLGGNPYAVIGVTPMIGVNDQQGELFQPADASKLVAWAKKYHAGRLSFWASQRDKQCPGGAKNYASDTCSGILQQPNAFGKIFATY
jgi:hypothetical protein